MGFDPQHQGLRPQLGGGCLPAGAGGAGSEESGEVSPWGVDQFGSRPPPRRRPSSPPSGGASLVQGLGPGHSAQLPKSRPQPGQDAKPGASPSPRTSAPAPGDRAGCPSLTGRVQRLARTPSARASSQGCAHPLSGASGHKPRDPRTPLGRRNLL